MSSSIPPLFYPSPPPPSPLFSLRLHVVNFSAGEPPISIRCESAREAKQAQVQSALASKEEVVVINDEQEGEIIGRFGKKNCAC